MNTLKQAKYEAIINETKKYILDKSLEQVTILDISKSLKIGEATIYRYFGTKKQLIIEVGVSLWKDLYQLVIKRSTKNTGYENINHFFSFFLEVYETQKQVYMFADQFDTFMINVGATKEELKTYEEVILQFKSIYDAHFQKGILDKTIKKEINPDLFYFTTTHMLIGLCKKLVVSPSLLQSDEKISDKNQIQFCIDMSLSYIKKED